jgi:hypothetical protein
MLHVDEQATTPIPFSVIEKQLVTKMEDKFADFALEITSLEEQRRVQEESLTVPKAQH